MRSNAHHTLGLTLLLLIGCANVWGQTVAVTGLTVAATNSMALAEANLITARKQVAAETTNSAAAWELGRACFTWGKLLKDPGAQEKIYAEGTAACRRAIAFDPNSAAAHYYLGMNVGRQADLKRNLAALGMVKEVEREFQKARELDEKLSHAGPDRNLGLLYHEAPGWPVSIGNDKLARKHLERAAKLAADYPENRLNLAEAYLEWREKKLFQKELEAIQQIWPVAKTNLTGVAWEADWLDWEQRRAKLATAAKSR